GEPVEVLECFDEEDEARQIASKIISFSEEHGTAFDSMAVLYRTNCQSRPLEEEFNRKDIPCMVVGAGGFYERKEIQAVLAILKLIQNPGDNESLVRILTLPGPYSKKLSPIILEHLCSCQHSPPQYLVAEIRDIVGLEDCLAHVEVHAEDNSIVQNLNQLEHLAASFESLDDFLAHTEKFTTKARGENTGCVQLMSIHRSKGLQWPVVFIAGCSEGILPHQNALGEDHISEAFEEERRLMYVAMTRSEKRLFISWVKSFNGKPGDRSRFIDEALADKGSEEGGGS
ncbi:MAG: ATP-dependent helicase, partial [Deltaproteobacteria bacterium]|nr:ATP-dependent helicase [Deltaproteobacteria bacterium]